MRRTRPDLIVPIRDRRQHRRILTLRNFRNACFVLVCVLAAITIVANVRGRKAHDGFGGLMAKRIESPTSLPKHPEVPPAEPIDDENAADPMLVQAAARGQILRDEPPVTPPSPTSAVATQGRPEAGATPVIVGGPEGVSVMQQQTQKPILHGGFGR